MTYIQRGQVGYSKYKVELDGKFLSWDEVWVASEEDGYVEKVLVQPEYDIMGYLTTPPVTRRYYGRVFVVNYSTQADSE